LWRGRRKAQDSPAATKEGTTGPALSVRFRGESAADPAPPPVRSRSGRRAWGGGSRGARGRGRETSSWGVEPGGLSVVTLARKRIHPHRSVSVLRVHGKYTHNYFPEDSVVRYGCARSRRACVRACVESSCQMPRSQGFSLAWWTGILPRHGMEGARCLTI
jgi:hypothetical protein